MSILWLFFLLTFFYAIIMLWISSRFKMIKRVPSNLNDKPRFSVSFVIAARNEEHTIRSCITSIKHQIYDGLDYEIIVVDDHSTDQTLAVLDTLDDVTVLKLDSDSFGKKMALQLGVDHASKEFIFFTDADCILSPNLVPELALYQIVNKSKLIAGPVFISQNNRLIHHFQMYDFMASMTITAAGFQVGDPIVCNGACLMVDRNVFLEEDGYEGNLHIPSGDDVFLLYKFKKKYPLDVHFIKSVDAYVQTSAVERWQDLYFQRLRWGTKQGAMRSKKSTILMVMFFLTSLLILIGPLFIDRFYDLYVYLSMLITKFLADALLILPIARYYRLNVHPVMYLLSFFIHTFYLQILVISSVFYSKFVWKDRVLHN